MSKKIKPPLSDTIARVVADDAYRAKNNITLRRRQTVVVDKPKKPVKNNDQLLMC